MSWERPTFGFYRPHDPVVEDGTLTDPRTGEVTKPPSMTKQAHVAECDINNILKQYRQTGVVRHISAKADQGVYTDLPEPIEFQDALNLVKRSESAFATLPSSVRTRFENDPAAFLAFVTDPANKDELVKLGLAKPPVTAPTAPTAPAPAPAPAGPGAAPAPTAAPATS